MENFSQECKSDANQPLARRDVLKKGLGLSLAPAVGTGSLLLTTKAEAAKWGPWYYINTGFDDITQPLMNRYPQFFNSITKTKDTSSTSVSMQWRNSASAMTKQGYVAIENSSNQKGVISSTVIAFFQFDQYYTKDGNKDLVDGTCYVKTIPVFSEARYSTEEYRRRRLANKNSTPMQGDFATIWNAWNAAGRPYSIDITLRPNQRVIISAIVHQSLGSGDSYATGTFSFSAELVTDINGMWTMTSQPVPVYVDYFMGGGSGVNDWSIASYVTLPFVDAAFNFNDTTNWNANALNVAGFGAYRNALTAAGRAYQAFADTEQPLQAVDTKEAGWIAATANAFGVGYAAGDGVFTGWDGLLLAGTVTVGCLAVAFASTRDRILGSTSLPRLNQDVRDAMASIIAFFGGAEKWQAHPRNAANVDLVALLQRFPRNP